MAGFCVMQKEFCDDAQFPSIVDEKQVVFCWSTEGVHIGRAWEGSLHSSNVCW